jgi:hypothetical protein
MSTKWLSAAGHKMAENSSIFKRLCIFRWLGNLRNNKIHKVCDKYDERKTNEMHFQSKPYI